MNAINDISLYLVQTVIGMYLVVMLLRFLLQLVRADFYNPISQFLVRATNPLVLPLRRLLPARKRFDPASLVLSISIQLLGIVVVATLFSYRLPGFSSMLAWSVVGVAFLLIQIYWLGILAVIILSFLAPGTPHPAAFLVYQLVEPVMAPFRRLIPPIGGLDLSPIALFVLINILKRLLVGLALGVGLDPDLVIGI